MFTRWIIRTVPSTIPSLMINRSISLSCSQFAAATKLKEQQSGNTDTTAKANPKNDKIESKSAKVEPIPPPINPAESNKTYSEKIHRLVDEISRLSLVDVMDLNELLKVID
jgi:hypothetical protein